MSAPPMRTWQNASALLLTLLAAGALLPLDARARLLCIAVAVAGIVVLLVVRLRAHRVRRDDARTGAVQARIDRIRAEREKRTKRPLP